MGSIINNTGIVSYVCVCVQRRRRGGPDFQAKEDNDEEEKTQLLRPFGDRTISAVLYAMV